MDLLPITVVFGTSLWVLIDSRNIGIKKGSTTGFFNMGPTGWFVACLLCWIAAFPMYLVKRREHLLTLATTEQAGSTESTDFVSQLGALTDLSTQGVLTAEEFRTKRLALVARMLEQTPHADFMSQLGTLADLSTQGFLTDEEFQVRKKELVHRMLDQSSDDGVLASN
jgi:hypothetical protein